ncbi:hypothetical protein POJ06DRAFT_34833 [Lipomyces tetrasporus]|uniref:NUC153 domain-containing protein n=1 Tax=Lipomyces tetrasporus TaxID=54092 RepID=A0AAD7QM28_9ASCO|nr:uncharacterized protein POJ06DRAFT_34833 [Lipomyces tetrasporus]KAJ8097578.1 hypothetical protein POJ06DRAFT_34833 [Lipomyces tetrasporus]
MAKRKSSNVGLSEQSKKPITTDPRFAIVHSDPRFAPPKKGNKIVLDSRFKSKLSADPEFKQRRVVDRYGRKVERDAAEKELKRYYQMEDDEKDEDALFGKSYDPARGEGLIASSSDEEDTEEEVDEEEDVFENTIQEEVIPRGDETSTLAVVNLDWDNVRAEDLMVAFSSFVSAGGKVLSVTIYPSEFGKERMAREEREGPPPEIFQTTGSSNDHDEDEGEEDEVNEKTIVKEDSGEDFDSSKLRKYQLQRLRYYYAIVKCDSVATAQKIYDGCDGTEYEATSNFFDLRYVPEDMKFDDKPKDVCTKIPATYRPNEFVTDALQHSKVKLTWDETPNERLQFARRAFSRREVEEMDFKAYLASSESEVDDGGRDELKDKDKLRDKYRSLLLESQNNTGFDSKADVDMEITFTPGLSAATETKEPEDETTIERYKRKERERRKQRIEKHKNKTDTEDKSFEDDFFREDNVIKDQKAAKKSKQERTDEERRKAELELLMMGEDDDSNLKHFDMRTIIKAEKQKKNKKLRKKAKASETMDDFNIDVKDPRFSMLYDHHEFAIDPSQPQFKETNAMKKLLDERRRRSQKKEDSAQSES